MDSDVSVAGVDRCIGIQASGVKFRYHLSYREGSIYIHSNTFLDHPLSALSTWYGLGPTSSLKQQIHSKFTANSQQILSKYEANIE